MKPCNYPSKNKSKSERNRNLHLSTKISKNELTTSKEFLSNIPII